MELRVNAMAVAATAVAMSMLPGSTYATGAEAYHVAPYLRAYQFPMVDQLQGTGTFVNIHLAPTMAHSNPMDEMLRVAHLLASESVDIDADISRFVDEEFWNLI